LGTWVLKNYLRQTYKPNRQGIFFRPNLKWDRFNGFGTDGKSLNKGLGVYGHKRERDSLRIAHEHKWCNKISLGLLG